MAEVIKQGNRWCVSHGRTGAVLKRKGSPVCFTKRSAANAEAKKTQCRVVGGRSCRT